MKILMRGIIVTITLLALWQGVIIFFHLPSYILPAPLLVIKTLINQFHLILNESIPTIIETVLGLWLGILTGILSALIMAYCRPIRLWFLPLLLISQALPTFAIAPLLVVWFGYGLTSKIITAMIMIFFPVTNAFYDGLIQTPSSWLDLAKTMNGSSFRILWHIRIPAALPSLATGIRVATAIAPIGAIVGEWVGASEGLGFLMLNANARMQIDLMFAVLIIIILLTLLLYFSIDKLLHLMVHWQKIQREG